MLRSAVKAVHAVSFEPIHPLSGVYVGVVYFKGCFARCRLG